MAEAKIILAIDDQIDNLATITAVIKSQMQNCRVLTALSGIEGIKIARKEQPDTILLDIIMPQMDGYEVCEILKTDEQTKHIPVVMVTAIRTDSESRIKGLNLGADAFLSKPIDPAEFVAQIKVMLRIKDAEDKLRAERKDLDQLVNLKTREISYQSVVLNNVPDPVITVDNNHNIISWNKEAEKLYGWKKTEVLNQAFSKIIKPEYPISSRENIINCLNTTGFFHGEVIHYTRSGKRLNIRGSVSYIKDESGEVIGTTSVNHDITEQKKTQHALEESEKDYKSLYKYAPLPYQSLDADGNIIGVNPAWLQTLNYSEEEVVGKWYGDFLDEKSRIVFKNNFPKLKSCGIVNDVPFKLKHKDGHYIEISLNGRAVYFDDGSFKQTYCVFKDVTQEKQAQKNLHQYKNIVSNSGDMLALVDKQHTFLAANASYANAFQLEAHQVIGKKISDLISKEQFDNSIRHHAEKCLKGEKVNFQIWIDFPNSENNFMDITYSPYKTNSHEVEGIVISARNITQRKRAEEAIEKKIIALTQPLDDINSITFDELFKLEEIQRIQDDFSKATKVASVITDLNGKPITKPSNFCRLCCDIIRKTEKGKANCYISDMKLGDFNSDGPNIHCCFSGGLWDAGAAITIGGRHIANWLIGQVRDETQTEEQIRRYAQTIGANEEETIEAFHEVPVMSQEQFKLIATSLHSLANQLSTSAFQNIQQARFISERKETEKAILKLSTAVEQSPSVITITNLDGNIEYVNPKFTEITGYTKEEAIGQNPRILKSGEQSTAYYQKMWDLISSGSEWRGELHNKKKNGEMYWESAALSPIIDTNGKITNFIKVGEDITENKRSEQIQKVIYNISNAVIISHNLTELIGFIQKELGTIIDTKNFFVALLDEKTGMLTLPFLADVMQTSTYIPAEKTLSAYVIKTKKPLLADKAKISELEKCGEIARFGPDSEIWMGIPLKMEERVTGVLVIQSYTNEHAFDQSDMKMLEFVSDQISISIHRKKAEEELRKALEHATESDRLKSTFLATMSHELRTPLNAIIGFSEIIEDESDLNRILNYTKTINNSGNHLLNIINDLLDISMIETGEAKISPQKFEINQVLKDVLKIIEIEQSTTNKQNLELKLIVPSRPQKLSIKSDPNKIKQILINLIKNAMKFTHEGHVHFGFTIVPAAGVNANNNLNVEKTKNDSFELQFFVSDTGIGISKDKQKYIFEIFNQIEDSRTRTYGGTGIGLSVAKKLTTLLGGKIWIESEHGKGSSFYFTIPFTP